MHLKMGKTVAADGIPAKDGFDLPRGAGSSQKAKRRAIIPDPRNDENLAVAQTHLAMIRFHNRVLDTLPASVPAAQKFATARELVTKHYQWMIRTDYLPRICRPSAVNNVFNQGRKVFEVGATPTDVPTMPIEFSVAGFRLGHSMVRAAYNWNKIFDDGSGSLDLLFTFSATGGNLGGGLALPEQLDRRLPPPLRLQGGRPQRARRAGEQVQLRQGDRHPHRRPAGQPAAVDVRRLRHPERRPAAEPRVPQPHPRAHGAARDRPADGDVHEEQGRQLPEADEGPDPRRQGRRRARHADRHAARQGAQGHAAVVLRPARGRVQRRPAARRRRADRRRDHAPRDGGQHRLDRARPGVPPVARARTTRRSGWPTSCSSRSRGRRRCWRRSAEPADRDPARAAACRGPPGCRARACRRARRRRSCEPAQAGAARDVRAADAVVGDLDGEVAVASARRSPRRASRCAYFATLASASETTK